MKLYPVLLFVTVLVVACRSDTHQFVWPAANVQQLRFGNGAADSLAVGVNVDTLLVERALQTHDKTLVIFASYTDDQHNFLTHPGLRTKKVYDALRNWQVVILYVDGRGKRNDLSAIDIGMENSRFQMHRFSTAAQPHYVIVKQGKKLCETSLMRSEEAIIGFLKNCEVV